MQTSHINEIEGYVLVVDDDTAVRMYLSAFLRKNGFSFLMCESATEAMAKLKENDVKLVLSDIRMPGISGLELLEEIRRYNSELPVILMTGYADVEIAIDAVNKGAFCFLTKPFNKDYLLTSIKRALEYQGMIESGRNYMVMLENTVMRKTRELEDTAMMANKLSLEIVQRLSAVAEFRDSYTAAHISRIGLYSRAIAETMNMYSDFIEAVAVASSLHDIGKIGIPDNILLKKDALTPEEREVMKAHTIMGGEILADSSHPTIRMASSIALNHHERWNGGGYPRGLKGKEIPIEARIVKLADQYDAIRSVRSYKPSLGHDEACRILLQGDERTSPQDLDPEVLEVFRNIEQRFDEIYSSHQD